MLAQTDNHVAGSGLAKHALRLSQARVLVVGDLMLDRFVHGTIERISPEAPVPVFSVGETKEMLGGAGNVLRNLSTIGAECVLVAAIGQDPAGEAVKALIGQEAGTHLLGPELNGHRTILKSRFVCGGQQVLRADEDMWKPLPSDAQSAIIDAVSNAEGPFGAVILSDYGKGVVSDAVIEAVLTRAKQENAPLLVDPKGSDFSRYRGAHYVTPNRAELAQATGRPTGDTSDVEEACAVLIAESGVSGVLATRSEQGMSLAESTVSGHDATDVSEPRFTHIPVRARDVFDVAGAGDTVISVFAAGLAVGADPAIAARLANFAGGVVVGKAGTATASVSEILASVEEWTDAPRTKAAISIEAAQVLAQQWQAAGLTVGFTNGCFDLLHPGHIHLLEQASSACDRLIVGLNSDTSVQRLKGTGRPIRSGKDRARVLSSLTMVDAVVEFEQDTPLELIQALRPNVLVKGADYRIDEVVGAAEVQGWGGHVVLAALLDGHSTTKTLAQMKEIDVG